MNGIPATPQRRSAAADATGGVRPLELQAIRKTFRLGQHVVTALAGIDLQVAAGEMVALTGPSGSGKTTMMNICGLIEHPDAGRVLIDQQDTGAWTPRRRTLARRTRVGFIFQGFNLVPVMTAWENVEYPLFLDGVGFAERCRRVRQQLEAVGLEEHAQHRPDQMSGGQRQRVAIARALIKRPRVVVADEPTASLDSQTAAQVVALMRELCHGEGSAFLLATHDLRLSGQCDRVLSLQDGVLR